MWTDATTGGILRTARLTFKTLKAVKLTKESQVSFSDRGVSEATRLRLQSEDGGSRGASRSNVSCDRVR